MDDGELNERFSVHAQSLHLFSRFASQLRPLGQVAYHLGCMMTGEEGRHFVEDKRNGSVVSRK